MNFNNKLGTRLGKLEIKQIAIFIVIRLLNLNLLLLDYEKTLFNNYYPYIF